MKEIYKIIGDKYRVSNFGNVKSFARKKPRLLKGDVNSKGYPVVYISVNGDYKTVKIHRLVACAFIPNIENKPCVNHKDGNKENNRADNLEWVTNSENTKHAYKNNLMGSENNLRNSRLDKSEVKQIRDLHKNKIYSVKSLSTLYGLSQSGINNIIYNKVWKNIWK